jgi:hypothetical protein
LLLTTAISKNSQKNIDEAIKGAREGKAAGGHFATNQWRSLFFHPCQST